MCRRGVVGWVSFCFARMESRLCFVVVDFAVGSCFGFDPVLGFVSASDSNSEKASSLPLLSEISTATIQAAESFFSVEIQSQFVAGFAEI